MFVDKIFFRYVFIGIFTTSIHWGVFILLTMRFSVMQGVANLTAFLIAVTFSYIVNAHWTFRAATSLRRYIIYTMFMAFIAGLTGYAGQNQNINPVLILCLFSGGSLVCGYIFSRLFLFKDRKS